MGNGYDTLVKEVKRLDSEGRNLSYIKAYLTLEDVKGKDIANVLKAAGVEGKGSKRGFIDAFFDYLVDDVETLTLESVEKYVLTSELASENNRRNLKLFLRYAKTVIAVRDKVGKKK